ncbi:anti-virulence regulator CigR family protein [Chromobacterium haemolyticum]|uniref:anti-virulence regulator CigR family protein n=1 Tax=Chromobacterium haemolyticum TaxID=394935 RepID=UPI00405577A6
MKRWKSWAALLLAAALAAPTLANPPEGKGQGQGKHKNKDQDRVSPTRTDKDLAAAGISVAAARRLALDSGVTGYKSLPPGMRKRLARGKPLPPGIAKKALPAPLLSQLPRHPGYEWRAVGADLVLVAASGLIADILLDVLR